MYVLNYIFLVIQLHIEIATMLITLLFGLLFLIIKEILFIMSIMATFDCTASVHTATYNQQFICNTYLHRLVMFFVSYVLCRITAKIRWETLQTFFRGGKSFSSPRTWHRDKVSAVFMILSHKKKKGAVSAQRQHLLWSLVPVAAISQAIFYPTCSSDAISWWIWGCRAYGGAKYSLIVHRWGFPHLTETVIYP